MAKLPALDQPTTTETTTTTEEKHEETKKDEPVPRPEEPTPTCPKQETSVSCGQYIT